MLFWKPFMEPSISWHNAYPLCPVATKVSAIFTLESLLYSSHRILCDNLLSFHSPIPPAIHYPPIRFGIVFTRWQLLVQRRYDARALGHSHCFFRLLRSCQMWGQHTRRSLVQETYRCCEGSTKYRTAETFRWLQVYLLCCRSGCLWWK